jgi:hypothetical protein
LRDLNLPVPSLESWTAQVEELDDSALLHAGFRVTLVDTEPGGF